MPVDGTPSVNKVWKIPRSPRLPGFSPFAPAHRRADRVGLFALLLAYSGGMSENLSINLDSLDIGENPTGAARGFSARKRNRHGRGRRGPLLDARLPGARTREEHFEDLLIESAERLADRWGDRVTAIDFRLMLVPNAKVLAKAQATGSRVPWATSRSGRPGRPERITVYRRPIEEASISPAELPEIVHLAVVEQLADLWAMDPQQIDPGYRQWGDGFGQ